MNKKLLIAAAAVMIIVNALVFVDLFSDKPQDVNPDVPTADTSFTDSSYTDTLPDVITSQSDAPVTPSDVVSQTDTDVNKEPAVEPEADTKPETEPEPEPQEEAIPPEALTGLTFGDDGYEVSRLQSRLYNLGYLTGSLDGEFGRNTERAVKAFQKIAGLHVTGFGNKETVDLLLSDNAPKAPESHDHEDVAAPNYKRDYYIIVYRKGCTVLVLGKDDYGRYNQVVKTFICSPGIEDGHATPARLYDIEVRYEWREMVEHTYAQYAIRLKGPITLHSVTYKKPSPDTLFMDEYEKLGQPASHGCVRMAAGDIKWIYDNVPEGTQVLITLDETGPEQPAAVPLNYDEAYKGWDPTDTRPENPYNN